MTKHELIQNLINARALRTEEEFHIFEDSMAALNGILTADDIEAVTKAFYDDTGDDEVMFGLVHLLEELNDEEALRQIALCTPNMTDAKDWAMTLNKRILNSQPFLKMYRKVIKSLDAASKEKILALLEDVKKDNPERFSEKIDFFEKGV